MKSSLIHVAAIALLLLATLYDQNWAENLATFWFWLMSIAAFLLVLMPWTESVKKQMAEPLSPRPIRWIGRATICFEAVWMIAFGWIVGGVYLISAIVFAAARQAARESAAVVEQKGE